MNETSAIVTFSLSQPQLTLKNRLYSTSNPPLLNKDEEIERVNEKINKPVVNGMKITHTAGTDALTGPNMYTFNNKTNEIQSDSVRKAKLLEDHIGMLERNQQNLSDILKIVIGDKNNPERLKYEVCNENRKALNDSITPLYKQIEDLKRLYEENKEANNGLIKDIGTITELIKIKPIIQSNIHRNQEPPIIEYSRGKDYMKNEVADGMEEEISNLKGEIKALKEDNKKIEENFKSISEQTIKHKLIADTNHKESEFVTRIGKFNYDDFIESIEATVENPTLKLGKDEMIVTSKTDTNPHYDFTTKETVERAMKPSYLSKVKTKTVKRYGISSKADYKPVFKPKAEIIEDKSLEKEKLPAKEEIKYDLNANKEVKELSKKVLTEPKKTLPRRSSPLKTQELEIKEYINEQLEKQLKKMIEPIQEELQQHKSNRRGEMSNEMYFEQPVTRVNPIETQVQRTIEPNRSIERNYIEEQLVDLLLADLAKKEPQAPLIKKDTIIEEVHKEKESLVIERSVKQSATYSETHKESTKSEIRETKETTIIREPTILPERQMKPQYERVINKEPEEENKEQEVIYKESQIKVKEKMLEENKMNKGNTICIIKKSNEIQQIPQETLVVLPKQAKIKEPIKKEYIKTDIEQEIVKRRIPINVEPLIAGLFDQTRSSISLSKGIETLQIPKPHIIDIDDYDLSSIDSDHSATLPDQGVPSEIREVEDISESEIPFTSETVKEDTDSVSIGTSRPSRGEVRRNYSGYHVNDTTFSDGEDRMGRRNSGINDVSDEEISRVDSLEHRPERKNVDNMLKQSQESFGVRNSLKYENVPNPFEQKNY